MLLRFLKSLVCFDADGAAGGGSGTPNGGGSGTQNGDGQNSNSNNNNGNGSGTQVRDRIVFDEEYVKSLRKEAGDNRVAANKHEARAKELETENAGLKSKLSELNLSSTFNSVARELGAVHPEVVFKLLDQSKLELDTEGKPNAEKLKTAVEELKKSYPEMFGEAQKKTGGNVDAGAGGSGASSNGNMNDFIRKSAGFA